jgi:hypothetical protein
MPYASGIRGLPRHTLPNVPGIMVHFKISIYYMFYLIRKIKNLNFDIFCKKTLCHSKTTITFAYDVGLKSFLYEKVSEQNFTSEFNNIRSFGQFLDSSNSKEKMDFFALIVL